MGESINSITNFVQLTNTIGTAGQPTLAQLPIIAESGYRSVINLALPSHEESIDTEAAIITSLGLDYVHIPVDFDAPTSADVKKFCGVMTALDHQPVFVHCIMNYRVSAFMYHYLSKVRGLDEDRARSSVFDHWHPDPVWQELMQWSKEETGLIATR